METQTYRPTVAERIDPTSPYYDAEFAALRVKAFGAWADHQQDMKTDPAYARAAKRISCK